MKNVLSSFVMYGLLSFASGCGDQIMFMRQRVELGILQANTDTPAVDVTVKLVPLYGKVDSGERPKLIAQYFDDPIPVSKDGNVSFDLRLSQTWRPRGGGSCPDLVTGQTFILRVEFASQNEILDIPMVQGLRTNGTLVSVVVRSIDPARCKCTVS